MLFRSPWFFSYNCNYLSSPPPAKELVTNQLISLQEKRKFELPAASREKSFLLIGLPLRETTCKKLRLDFLSPTGESVGIAKILEPRGQVLSFFIAEKPPASASQFEINSEDVLCSPEKMGKIVQQKSEPQPLAIWMGR